MDGIPLGSIFNHFFGRHTGYGGGLCADRTDALLWPWLSLRPRPARPQAQIHRPVSVRVRLGCRWRQRDKRPATSSSLQRSCSSKFFLFFPFPSIAGQSDAGLRPVCASHTPSVVADCGPAIAPGLFLFFWIQIRCRGDYLARDLRVRLRWFTGHGGLAARESPHGPPLPAFHPTTTTTTTTIWAASSNKSLRSETRKVHTQRQKSHWNVAMPPSRLLRFLVRSFKFIYFFFFFSFSKILLRKNKRRKKKK